MGVPPIGAVGASAGAVGAINSSLSAASLQLGLAATLSAPSAQSSGAPVPRLTPAEELKKAVVELGPEAVVAPDYKPGQVRHIVLFRYKESVTDEQKAEVKRRFLALRLLCARSACPYIVSIETGRQNSSEGVDQQFEQGFLVTFRSEGDRNFYVGQPIITEPRFYDPAHQAFKEFVGPLLLEPVNPSGVLVFDYAVEAAAVEEARAISARTRSDAEETARRLSEAQRDPGVPSGGRGITTAPGRLSPSQPGATPSAAAGPAAPVGAGGRRSSLPLLVGPTMLGIGVLMLAFPTAGGVAILIGVAGMFGYLAWKTYRPAKK